MTTPIPPERQPKEPKPSWLRVRAPGGESYTRLKQTLRKLDLYTVCEEARCPNVGECWTAGTATIMLLGHTCTRGCRFCAVTTGNPRGAFDPREPEHVARAIAELDLKYVVLTMVDRDDLIDGGAAQVARTVSALRARCPELLVETLVGDFRGRFVDVETVLDSAPDVFAHNIEVVRRLTPTIRDARCRYDVSLAVLAAAKRRAPERFVKSSIMVGLGEEPTRGARDARRSSRRRRQHRDARAIPATDAETRRGRALCDARRVCRVRKRSEGARIRLRCVRRARALELSRGRGIRRGTACRQTFRGTRSRPLAPIGGIRPHRTRSAAEAPSFERMTGIELFNSAGSWSRPRGRRAPRQIGFFISLRIPRPAAAPRASLLKRYEGLKSLGQCGSRHCFSGAHPLVIPIRTERRVKSTYYS